MASPFILYSANKDDFRLVDLVGPTIKLALLGFGYVPASGTTGDSLWADVSSYEVAEGSGYTAGGATVPSVSVVATSNGFTFSSSVVTWNSVGIGIPEHFYYVMYVSGSLWGKASPLIGYFVANSDTLGIPLTPPGSPLSVTPPGGGWFDLA
jgi:hypothetical protein